MPTPTDEPVTGYSSGLRAIMARDFLLTEKHQELSWRADRKGADHRILLFEHKFLTRMDKLGVPMYAHTIVRSLAEQTAKYVQGHSKAKAGQSAHNYGLAVDLVHSIKHWDLPDESWRLIGHIGKEIAAQNGIKITWGGDFKSIWDPAHWELKDWKVIANVA